jgi:tetratricopeptide (TPR) repeat protein
MIINNSKTSIMQKSILSLIVIIIFSSFSEGAKMFAQNNADSLNAYWANPQNPDSLRANALYNLAVQALNVNPDSAWSRNQRLLAFAEDKNMLFFKAKALNGLGSVKSRTGDHQSALKYGNEALQIFRDLQDQRGIAGCFINMAFSFYMLGHVNLSIKYVIKGTKICEKNKYEDYLINGYNFIGYMYYSQKNFADALKYMLKTDSLISHLGIAVDFGMKTNLGIVYHELGQYDKSIATLKRSLEVQRELNQKANLSNTIMELGNAYGKTGDFDLAIKYIDKAIVVAKENDQMTEMSNAMLIKGKVYLKMNEYDKAIRCVPKQEKF